MMHDVTKELDNRFGKKMRHRTCSFRSCVSQNLTKSLERLFFLVRNRRSIVEERRRALVSSLTAPYHVMSAISAHSFRFLRYFKFCGVIWTIGQKGTHTQSRFGGILTTGKLSRDEGKELPRESALLAFHE
jgi:hypothetical protein